MTWDSMIAGITSAGIIITALPVLAGEAAVGRLNHAGYRDRMHCTATLIAPDQILTAGHCVRDQDVGELHVLAGYERGDWVEDLRPSTVVRARPPRDVAALCLKRHASVSPLPLAARAPVPGEELIVYGYPIPRSHVQSRTSCAVAIVDPSGKFSLTCPLKSGASGAPVIRNGREGRQIVGIVSGSNTSHTLAYGVTAAEDVPRCK